MTTHLGGNIYVDYYLDRVMLIEMSDQDIINQIVLDRPMFGEFLQFVSDLNKQIKEEQNDGEKSRS